MPKPQRMLLIVFFTVSCLVFMMFDTIEYWRFSSGYNMTLSRNRADVVAQALERDGVPSGGLTIWARGEQDLIVQTADQVNEPKNRAVVIAFAVPRTAGGRMMDDQAYCKALSAKYRDYARANIVAPAAANAMHQCDIGETAAAIPVLEKLLNDGQVPLPPRG